MIKKRKTILLVVAIIATTNLLFAQSYTNTPNDSVNMEGVMEGLHTLSIQQINNTNDTITLQWQKVSENLPANWEASVCDNSLCNTSLVNVGVMNPIFGTDYGLLLLHITPHVNYGTAIIKYAVWDIANASNKDTLTYILTVSETSSIAKNLFENSFQIYPIPASNFLNIKSNSENRFDYQITDIIGKLLLTGITIKDNTPIETEKFTNGNYFISVIEKNKKQSTKQFIIQH